MHDHEILVHIAAPSGARDDARYRAQVAAILNFNPVSRETIDPSGNLGVDDCSGGESLPLPSAVLLGGVDCPESEDVGQLSQLARSPVKTDSRPSTAPAICAQKQLDQSPPAPVPVPAPVSEAAAYRHRYFSDASLETPVSVISDSQAPQSASTTSESQQRSQPSQVELPSTNNDALQETSQNQNVPPDSVHPTQSEGKNKAPRHTTELVLQTRSSKPHRSNPSLPQSIETISLDKLPLEIRPNPPQVSHQKFQTHITPTLKALAERMNLSKRYQPLRQTRSLASLERGYWLLQFVVTDFDPDDDDDDDDGDGSREANHWPISLFRRFWSFLVAFITGNRAGWGTWCIVEPESDIDSTTRDPVDDDDHRRHYRLSCKIYCWGEIVPHMYIVLLLATERRIKKMGAQWRDGADKVVVQMPGL
ncbi:hypothetical protein VTN31DRAFT_1219 [Thermomyces dupontii]|uniref:uncharacterized protein n=1 Tax=Talaromyces thermophilus TaxID=28565 RepID=UPI003743FDBB